MSDIGRVVDKLGLGFAIGARRLVNASIGKRHEHDVGLGIVGAHRPILATRKGWADPVSLVDIRNHRRLVHADQSFSIDLRDKVLRGPRRAFGLVANMPEAFPSGLTGVLMIIISNVHSWSQLSRGKVWCFQTTSPVLGLTAKRVLVPAIVPPIVPRCASEAGPAPLDP